MSVVSCGASVGSCGSSVGSYVANLYRIKTLIIPLVFELQIVGLISHII